MNRLTEICEAKKVEVNARKAITSAAELDTRIAAADPPRGFERALRRTVTTGYALIAEIKKASPSKGLIREDFRPAEHARAYADGGATCLSVLTESRYFLGADAYLVDARDAVPLPVLRKDFVIDPWQVKEARALGADAVLLIVAALDDSLLADCEAAALEVGLDVLIEVHDEAELERALRMRSSLIGVNNRDLRSFATDLAVTERLAALAPREVLLVGESGIAYHADCERLARAGVRSFLVGESLMRQQDVEAATRRLLLGEESRASFFQ